MKSQDVVHSRCSSIRNMRVDLSFNKHAKISQPRVPLSVRLGNGPCLETCCNIHSRCNQNNTQGMNARAANGIVQQVQQRNAKHDSITKLFATGVVMPMTSDYCHQIHIVLCGE
eukprot:Blabericola_migrator_1__11060@NODE_643_length_7105_cov_97_345553_g472_i0_p5_GENE_NODE_643_length_7105_cov_97_345553_g472_i0NODE_643_length_7105_cov_97_345553_g472_i0_p5_ORF_typecomplete_len114_score10_08_NODE_643_length_7105_cov_97_345553_g472_i031223463